MMEVGLDLEPITLTSLARPRLNRQEEQSSGQIVSRRDQTSLRKHILSKMLDQVLTILELKQLIDKLTTLRFQDSIMLQELRLASRLAKSL